MGNRRMGGADAAWYRMGTSTNHMVVTAALRLDAGADWDRIEEAIEQRLVGRYPPFRRRIVTPSSRLAPMRWAEDPRFSFDAHVQRVRLPGDRCARLAATVSEALSTPLDLSRSPWQVQLLQDDTGACAILARLHHSLADGVALARVLLELTDDATTGGPTRSGEHRQPREGRGEGLLGDPRRLGRRLSRGARLAGRGASSIVRLLTLSPDPQTALKGNLGPVKHAAWTEPIPLEEIKRAARARAITVNDVLLAAVTGALRKELEARGNELRDVRTIIPVNLRPLDAPVPPELGNRFGLVFLSLPVATVAADDRLDELKARMDVLKGSAEAGATYTVLTALGLLPSPVQDVLVGYLGRKATMVLTNVRGPDQMVSLGGSRVRQILFWVPQAARVGLGISLLSYAGEVTIGLSADAGVVPDPQRLVDAMSRELRGVLAT